MAAAHGWIGIVELLLEHTIGVGAKDNYGFTAVKVAGTKT